MNLKRSFLFLLILFTCVKFTFGQTAFYDALSLRSLIDARTGQFNTAPDSLKKAGSILYNYLSLSQNQTPAVMNYQAIQAALSVPNSKNYNPLIIQYLSNPGAGVIPLAGLSAGLQDAGSLDVGNFANGIAQFLIERGKQELNVAFFSKLKGFLTGYPEIKIVFPATSRFIGNVDSYNYAAIMPALRAAFQQDINNISANLINLRYTANYDGYSLDPKVKKRADEITAFLNNDLKGRSIIGALLVSRDISKGTDAADIIKDIASDKICFPNDAFSNSIKFVDLLSGSLRSSDNNKVWVSADQISALLRDDITLRLYLSLIYAENVKNYQIEFAPGVTLKKFLTDLNTAWNTNAAVLQNFKNTFMNVADYASQVSDNTSKIEKSLNSSDGSNILLYADYTSSIAGFLKATLNLLPANSNITAGLAQVATDVQGFTAIIDDAANLVYYIKSQNYGAAILSTSSLIPSILSNTTYTFNNKINTNDFIKYGSFMASVIDAKTPADVTNAIEAVALPAGSYSIKQKSMSNISLNGYLGYAWDIGSGNGISAPIGFSGTLGADPNKHPRGVPVSLFVSIIDVGALVSYNANNPGTSNSKQQVTLESIIAPSAQLFFEIPNLPIAFGGGYRLTPKLSYSQKDGVLTIPSKGAFNLSVLIDIPFFTLYNKSF